MTLEFERQNPELYAREILYSFGFKTTPIDPFIIGDYLGLKFTFEDIRDAEAYLLVSCGKKLIVMKDFTIFTPRINFTVAHEIGHYYLPWHKNHFFKCKSSDIETYNHKRKQEIEANIFASELIIPSFLIKQDINKLQFNINNIKQLSIKYNTSLTSLAIKAIQFTYDPVCIVFTEHNRIKWFLKSDSFIGTIYDTGYNLNQYSNAYYFYNSGKNFYGEPEHVYSAAWLKDGNLEDSIIEETFVMKNLNSTLTILKNP